MSLLDILRINSKYRYTMLSYAYISMMNNVDIDDIMFNRLDLTDIDIESFMKGGLISSTCENLERLKYGKLNDVEFNSSISTSDNALVGEFMNSQKAFIDSLNSFIDEENTDNVKGKALEDTKAFVNIYNWYAIYSIARLKLGFSENEFWFSSLGEIRTLLYNYGLIESGKIEIMTVKETQYVKDLESSKDDIIEQVKRKRRGVVDGK